MIHVRGNVDIVLSTYFGLWHTVFAMCVQYEAEATSHFIPLLNLFYCCYCWWCCAIAVAAVERVVCFLCLCLFRIEILSHSRFTIYIYIAVAMVFIIRATRPTLCMSYRTYVDIYLSLTVALCTYTLHQQQQRSSEHSRTAYGVCIFVDDFCVPIYILYARTEAAELPLTN